MTSTESAGVANETVDDNSEPQKDSADFQDSNDTDGDILNGHPGQHGDAKEPLQDCGNKPQLQLLQLPLQSESLSLPGDVYRRYSGDSKAAYVEGSTPTRTWSNRSLLQRTISERPWQQKCSGHPTAPRSNSCPSAHIPKLLKTSLSASFRIKRMSSEKKFREKHGHIYRGLLRTLLHPLGTPDATIGLRPGDLLDHMSEVYEVNRDEHEMLIREELTNKPTCLQVNIGLIEANGIKNPDSADDSLDSFCVLTVHHPSRGRSPRLSPRHSPYDSPAASPSISRKGTQFSMSADSEEQRSTTIRHSAQPKWNEEFQLEIEEFWHDEVHIYLYSQGKVPEEKHQTEKHGVLKSFLGLRKNSGEPEKYNQSGILGKIVIPIRDISCFGTDQWFDILSYNSYSKHKAVGKCHVKLGISYKQNPEDGLSYSTEDYYQAYLQFLNNTYRNSSPKRCVDDQYGLLSIKDNKILQMFAQAHGISKISQSMTSVICLLELYCEENEIEISETALHHAIDELRMTWASAQIGQINFLEKMPLTDTEISHYRKTAIRYIQHKSDSMTELPDLFPPTSETLNNLKAKLGVTVQLLGIDLWEGTCTPLGDIAKQLLLKLQVDVNRWISDKIGKLSSEEEDEEIKDTVIPQMERLVDLVEMTSSHCSHCGAVKQYFTCLGIQYYKVASYAVEKLISDKSMDMMFEMNKYMKRYNSYDVNIMNASKLTLRLYLALRRFNFALRDNINRREAFRLPLFHYQEWFEEAMVYWLQTFRSECLSRMEKALEIDKDVTVVTALVVVDVVVVTALVKYSHSSVDVLSCFAAVIDEWRRIDVHDPDYALMGVTKVTDIICDGARLYVDKIHVILERNGYYDSSLNAGFDVTDRLCITLNNIEHVRRYLKELPNLLNWEHVAILMSARYVADEVGTQATDTLQRLIDTTNEEILQKSWRLLRQIAEKMRVEMEKYMEIFTKRVPEKASLTRAEGFLKACSSRLDKSVDYFIGYLNTNLQTLHNQLMPDIYPHMIEEIWKIILKSFHIQLEVGKHPDYYEQCKLHLRAVSLFLLRIGLDEKKVESEGYAEMKKRLDLNSKPTEELMLNYFLALAKHMGTPTEYFGHMALKAAYMEETRGNVTIFVKVLKGTDLPGLDTSGLSDPYVEASLQPHIMFEDARMQKTSVVRNTLNPTFNTLFQFPNIPKNYLKIKGCCILLTIMDHDNIGMDDFAGEIFVHLPSLERLGLDENIEKKPAIIMPLKRPSRPRDGPYEVLSQREWDKNAKRFIVERQRFIDNQPERTDKNKLTADAPDVGFLSAIFSNILH